MSVHSASPKRVIQAELEPGERLLWAGQPAQGIKFHSADMMLIPFSLLWGGFAIFWEYMAIRKGELPFILFGIPFVLVGLYIMFGRFFLAARMRANTFYGLTDKRVLIVSGFSRKKAKSLDLRTLDEISLSESADGSGTIVFGRSNALSMAGSGWLRSGAEAPRFEFIANARRVYQKIREAREHILSQASNG